MRNFLVAIAVAAAVLASVVHACGTETDCRIEDGTYRIYVPGTPEADRPGAIVFAHGYRGTAAGTMRNENLRALADDLGVALIAVKSFDEDWTIPNAPSAGTRPERDEVAYYGRVVSDAADRFGLDRDRMLATGFSAGGMMTWEVVCNDSALFAGFAPVSGTFWDPVPDTCIAPPATLIHIHGTSDRVVPMAGRPIGPTKQGDVNEALAMYRAHGGFDTELPETVSGNLTCNARLNDDGDRLELCLHSGGHGFRTAYIRRAWDLIFSPG
ncbi:MAG: polyhydroxybutyrate depolymerase [Pseudomonadota bacterium]